MVNKVSLFVSFSLFCVFGCTRRIPLGHVLRTLFYAGDCVLVHKGCVGLVFIKVKGASNGWSCFCGQNVWSRHYLNCLGPIPRVHLLSKYARQPHHVVGLVPCASQASPRVLSLCTIVRGLKVLL